MPQWDYSRNGVYFITLVTQNRECNLGYITDLYEMRLSDFGKIISDEWLKSFEMRTELFLDEYVIMPNHLHAIVILDNQNDENAHGTIHGAHGMAHGAHGTHVETHGRASLPQPPPSQPPPQSPQSRSTFIRKPKSISSFIAGLKSAINTKIDDYIDEHRLNIPKYNKNNHFFQSNYHDRIVRNYAEYQRIKNYIINNPAEWSGDMFNRT